MQLYLLNALKVRPPTPGVGGLDQFNGASGSKRKVKADSVKKLKVGLAGLQF